MNDIKFIKMNGGLGKTATRDDVISGLLMYMPELAAADLMNANQSEQFEQVGTNKYVAVLRYKEQLSKYGITEHSLAAADVTGLLTADEHKKIAAKNAICYHVSSFFGQSESGTLYLYISTLGGGITKSDIKALQNYSNGSIRQAGVLTPTVDDALLTTYQAAATELESEHEPLSLVVTTTGKTVTVTQSGEAGSSVFVLAATAVTGMELSDFTGDDSLVASGRCNLSMLIGTDLAGDTVEKLGHYAYYGIIGTCIGTVSRARVNESIAWVQEFPLGLSVPGFISGDKLKEVSITNQESINHNRYIFVRSHVGDADNYFNESHTLDLSSSDYAYIETERTIDKATRGIRSRLLPQLSAPLKVDATTGELDSPTVAFLETEAGKALEDMEKAGELSGYSVAIDPAQNVLTTSTVEIVVKQVGVGVMRTVNVKIGYTTKLN